MGVCAVDKVCMPTSDESCAVWCVIELRFLVDIHRVGIP